VVLRRGSALAALTSRHRLTRTPRSGARPPTPRTRASARRPRAAP
jgi:hypothetical protein